MPARHRIFALLAMAFLCAGPGNAQAPEQPVTVFAAASLTNALQEIADLHGQRGRQKVRLSFAASSTLAKQIEAGAKAQIFVSADEAWMDYLAKRDLVEAGTRRAIAGNRLVLVVPTSARPAEPSSELAGDAWLKALPQGRIATGDPAHVPVGRYAEQALRKLGLWEQVSPRLARADNVRSALILVERGEAVAGIVYSTDAAASRQVAVAGAFPRTSHGPIIYPAALVKGEDKGEARRFYDALFSAEGRAVLVKHGFAMD